MVNNGKIVEQTDWGESEIRGPVHLFRERLLMRLFRSMQTRGTVLDAGCGSGSLALDLCAAGYEVEAVEESEAFVETVRQKVQFLGWQERLRVRRASVTELPFEDSTFDGLVCGEVLEHVLPEDGGDGAAVQQFRRVLKPGGVLIASVPLNPRLWDYSDDWARHVKRYYRSDFVSLFEEEGFVVEKVRVWGFPLGRLYHRLFFAPWLLRTRGQAVEEREGRADTRVGRHRWVVESVAWVLRFDEFFARWPWGRGVVVAARRS